MPKPHVTDLTNGNNHAKDEMSLLHERIEMKPVTRMQNKDNGLFGDPDDPDEVDDWALEKQLVPKDNCLSLMVCFIQRCVGTSMAKLKRWTRGYFLPGIFLLGYLAYFIAAMHYKCGDEGSARLLGFTILGLAILSRHFIARNGKRVFVNVYGDERLSDKHAEMVATLRFFLRWLCYGGLLSFMVMMLINVAAKDPSRLRSMPGLFVFLLICLLSSSNPGLINWHTIFWSLGLQFVCAYLMLEFSIGKDALLWIQYRLNEYFANTHGSSEILFGKNYKAHRVIFGAIPLFFYVSGTISALYYLGAMQFVVRVIGSFLSFVLDAQPVEAMSVGCSIFLEGIVSLLSLKPYLMHQSRSQLFVIITSNLSSLGAAYLAILLAVGVSLHHIIPAMLISAPATFTVCKLMMPDTRPKNSKLNQVTGEDNAEAEYSNLLEAIQDGAMYVLPMIANIVVVAFTLLAIISWTNNTLAWFGDRVGVDGFTAEFIFSYLLYPVALAMGIELGDCRHAASLLGHRIISSNIIPFIKMGEFKANRFIYEDYMRRTNFTGPVSYDGDTVHLRLINATLAAGFITERTEVIMTYALCGFSGFLSVSISVGLFYTVLPERRAWLSKLFLPALISGNITNFMTGCFASLYYKG